MIPESIMQSIVEKVIKKVSNDSRILQIYQPYQKLWEHKQYHSLVHKPDLMNLDEKVIRIHHAIRRWKGN